MLPQSLLSGWISSGSLPYRLARFRRQAEIRGDLDLGIKLYPLTWMNWDYVQDCYHGQAMITGLLPNQIFVNKLFAMSMISLMTLAYPKVVSE